MGRTFPIPSDWALPLLWTVWGACWLLVGLNTRRAKRAEPRRSRLVHVALLICAFLLLFSGPLRMGPLGAPLLSPGPAPGIAGFCLVALGLSFATWARFHLGRDWSGGVAIKCRQRLVKDGPYAIVRHPIYGGLLVAIAGSALAAGDLAAAVAVPVAAVAYCRKIPLEERWLAQEFGDIYASYRRDVGALLPYRGLHSRLRASFARGRRRLLDPADLTATMDRLQAGGHLSAERAELLRQQLPDAMARSAYVLRHLGAHLALGGIFAFDVIPLPLGTVSRVAWVAGNRVYESAFGSKAHARVHSLRVLLVALIPWLGYCAYLLPLRRESPWVVWLYAQHLSYSLHGVSLDEFVAAKPRMLRRASALLIPRPPEEALQTPRPSAEAS